MRAKEFSSYFSQMPCPCGVENWFSVFQNYWVLTHGPNMVQNNELQSLCTFIS